MSAQSRKLRGSLGDSWGDAEYNTESDDGQSIHSASDFGSDLEDKDELFDSAHQEHQDKATPLPSRLTRASSREPQPQHTPVRTTVNRAKGRSSASPQTSPQSQRRSIHSTPGSGSLEPSFIMPSFYDSTNGYNTGSPLRNSQIRPRKPRQSAEGSQTSSRMSNSRRSSRTESVNQATTSPGRPKSKGSIQPKKDSLLWYYFDLFHRDVLGPILKYVLSTIVYAGYWLQPIMGLLVAIGALLLLISYGSSIVHSAVSTALAPVCHIPGASYLPICASTSRKSQSTGFPHFDELLGVQSSFEGVLSSAKDTSELPFTMRNSEIAIRDVRTVVRHSKLPSRAELENELDNFLATAKEASGDLIRYNSRLGYMTDRLISTNKWTRDVLRGLEEKESGTGTLGRIASGLNPLSVFMAPTPSLHQQVFDQYVKHISRIKDDIIELIKMAEALLTILDVMENRLDGVSDIAQRDGVEITANRDELLSRLWTKLGGNSVSRKQYEQKLQVLTQVLGYKRLAATHIGDTLDKLRSIAAQLENLRDSAATPEIVGWRDDVPWTLHLEDIETQTERLQIFRKEQLDLEHGQYRKVMDRAEPGNQLPSGTDGSQVVYAKREGAQV